MNRRLENRFSVNEPVAIYFKSFEKWVAGRVVAFDFPGVWVETTSGQRYFVTNTRRIRSLAKNNGHHEG